MTLATSCLRNADTRQLEQGHDLNLSSPGERIEKLELPRESGDLTELCFDQQGVDIDIRLFAPNGELVLTWDSPTGHWGRELVCFKAETRGTYSLAISAPDPDERGTYRVVVRPTDPARLSLFQAGYKAVASATQGLAADQALAQAQQGWEQAGEFEQAFALVSRRVDLERDPDREIALRRQGLALLEQANAPQLTAMAWHNLGVAWYRRGDLENELAAYETALQFRAEPTRDRADTLFELGRFHTFVGAVDRARAPLEEARRIYEQCGHTPSRARLLALSGWNHHAAGAYALALADYRQGLALIPKGYPQLAFNLHNYAAMTHIARGEPRAALASLAQAEGSLADQRELRRRAVIAVNRAEALMLLARWPEALALLEQLPAASFANPAEEAHLHYDLAVSLRALGRLDEARGHIEHAMEIVNGNRHPAYLHAEFLASRLRYADLQLEVEALTRSPQESLGMAEGRHRRHAESEAAAPFDRRRVLELGRLIGERAWRVPSGRPDARLEALLADYDAELQRGLHREPSELQATAPLEPGWLRKNLLDADTGLLYFGLGTNRVFAWYIDQHHFEVRDLGERRALEAVTLDYHEAIKDPSTEPVRLGVLGRHLAAALLDPILPPKPPRRLLIVPDGDLFHLPFAALPYPSAAAPDKALVTSCELTILASCAEALQLKQRSQSTGTHGLLLGNPEFGGDFTALAGAHRELQAIAAIAAQSGHPCTVLEGPEASKQALLMHPELGRVSLIHLATHGLYYAPRPELSSLVLATRDQHGQVLPGYLHPQEINGLKLDAQLVVLSSCETALGRNQRVQGLDGFAGAFIRAGARGVLVSLWPVDDKATAQFMTHFYQALFQKSQSPAAALAATQLAMLQDSTWSNPCFWAGFIYRGKW